MRLNKNEYICALDIGCSKLSAALAKVAKREIREMVFEGIPAKGIRDGSAIDSIELIACIERLMRALKAKSGVNVKCLLVNISGRDIVTKHSRAIVPLAERGNKVITASDIRKANEQARILGSSLDEEILHIIPSGYNVDFKNNVLNPVGLYGHRLEVDLYLVSARLSSLQTLSRIVHQAGYEVKEVFFSGAATTAAVMEGQAREGLNIFCDIGRDITELMVFKDGLLRDIEILATGGDRMALQLQEELKLPYELAEEIKKSYGLAADPREIDPEKEILIKKNTFYKPIKQRLVAEIVSASAKSICLQVKEAVEKKLSCYEVNSFVLTGRAALLEGFIELLEGTLSIPVRFGRITNPAVPPAIKENSELSGQRCLAYLTCIGMICAALQERMAAPPSGARPAGGALSRALQRAKEIYQEYF